MAVCNIESYASHIPNAFTIFGPQLMKWCTEVITQAVVLRNVGDTAVVIFAPTNHPQYDLHSSHMAVCKQAASTHKCHKVVIRLCKGSRHNTLTFICEKELLSVTALYMSIDYPCIYPSVIRFCFPVTVCWVWEDWLSP